MIKIMDNIEFFNILVVELQSYHILETKDRFSSSALYCDKTTDVFLSHGYNNLTSFDERTKDNTCVFHRPVTAEVIGFPRSYNNPLEDEAYTGWIKY